MTPLPLAHWNDLGNVEETTDRANFTPAVEYREVSRGPLRNFAPTPRKLARPRNLFPVFSENLLDAKRPPI
jgi:hypothetical protein